MSKPPAQDQSPFVNGTNAAHNPDPYGSDLRTPTTCTGWNFLRGKVENEISTVDDEARFCFQKMANATENPYAECALLFDQNRLLFEQNNEKVTRKSIKPTVVGCAKIMCYDDIVEARKKRDEVEVSKGKQTARKYKCRIQEMQMAEKSVQLLRGQRTPNMRLQRRGCRTTAPSYDSDCAGVMDGCIASQYNPICLLGYILKDRRSKELCRPVIVGGLQQLEREMDFFTCNNAVMQRLCCPCQVRMQSSIAQDRSYLDALLPQKVLDKASNVEASR